VRRGSVAARDDFRGVQDGEESGRGDEVEKKNK